MFGFALGFSVKSTLEIEIWMMASIKKTSAVPIVQRLQKGQNIGGLSLKLSPCNMTKILEDMNAKNPAHPEKMLCDIKEMLMTIFRNYFMEWLTKMVILSPQEIHTDWLKETPKKTQAIVFKSIEYLTLNVWSMIKIKIGPS